MSVDLFENNIIRPTIKKYSEVHSSYTFSVTQEVNQAIIKVRESEGLSKRAVVEFLIMKALKDLGFLKQDEAPLYPPANVTGRKSFKKDDNVMINGKMSIPTHNAMMNWKQSDNNIRNDTKPVLMQRLIVIALRLHGVKIEKVGSNT